MTPQHPAAPEGETDASGCPPLLRCTDRPELCPAPCSPVERNAGTNAGVTEREAWIDRYFQPGLDTTVEGAVHDAWDAATATLRERLRVVEGERDAAVAEAAEMSGWIEEHALVKTLARIAEWQEATGAELPGMARAAMLAYAARAESAEAAHAALVAGVEELGDEPVAPYPAECSCSHGMGFQFHAYPCRYSREVPRSAVRALLAGGGA